MNNTNKESESEHGNRVLETSKEYYIKNDIGTIVAEVRPVIAIDQAVIAENSLVSDLQIDLSGFSSDEFLNPPFGDSKKKRCEGIRAINSTLCKPYVQGGNYGNGVSNGIMTAGSYAFIDHAEVVNPAYACCRADANITILNKPYFRFDEHHEGMRGRYLACNNADQLIIYDGVFSSNLPIETHTVIDLESDNNGTRSVLIDKLIIDHENYVPKDNNLAIKIAGARKIDLTKISSNQKSKIFLQVAPDGNKHAETILVSHSEFFGQINCQGTQVEYMHIRNCHFKGGTDIAFDNIQNISRLIVEDCIFDGYRQMFGNDGFNGELIHFKGDNKWRGREYKNIFYGVRHAKDKLVVDEQMTIELMEPPTATPE